MKLDFSWCLFLKLDFTWFLFFKDHYDIKMLTYLMLIRLAALCPTQVLQRLDRLVDPIKQTCVAKVKANAVKQEYEKQDELKRCAMRAVLALQVKTKI